MRLCYNTPMKQAFNDISPRSRVAQLLDEWGVDYTVRPGGVFLLEGREAFPRDEKSPATERKLARALSEKLYGTDKALIILDMWNFAQPHEAIKLFGAPPGFVGSGEPAFLTKSLRERPECLLFLDEIDKAHPQVVKTLDAGIAAGSLTDNAGVAAPTDRAVVVAFSASVSPATEKRRKDNMLVLRRDLPVSRPLRYR